MFTARRVAPVAAAIAVLVFPSACRDAVEPEAVRIPGDASLAKGGNGGGGGGGGGGKPSFKMIFESMRSGAGDTEIYSMNADGSGVVALTSQDAGSNFNASMSADRTRIAFESTRDGNSEIYVMNADGTGAVNITNNAAWDAFPQLSPDGNRIVFVSNRSGVTALYVMNAEAGANANEVSNTIGGNHWSKWAPDGRHFVFGDTRGGIMSDLAVANNGGVILRYLSNTVDWVEIDPDWSPDGSKIAFSSDRTGEGEIYVISALGTDEVRLTQTTPPPPLPAFPTSERQPVWSPDGSRIAFRSARDAGNLDIYVMNADGSGQTRLTTASAADDFPVWSPDGKQIAFTSRRDGNVEIYTMSATGKMQRNVTNNVASDGNPTWKP